MLYGLVDTQLILCTLICEHLSKNSKLNSLKYHHTYQISSLKGQQEKNLNNYHSNVNYLLIC